MNYRDRFLTRLGKPACQTASESVAIEIPVGWSVTLLGDASVSAGIAEARDGTVSVTGPDGAMAVTDVRDGVVREWVLSAPEMSYTPERRVLPEPVWGDWRSGLDDVLATEIAELESEGTDVSALVAAGVLLVHDHDHDLTATERIAALLAGRVPRRRPMDWVAGLDLESLREIESESVAEVSVFRRDCVEAGWRSRRDIPRLVRIQRDRWEMLRVVLREHGLGSEIGAALDDLDAVFGGLHGEELDDEELDDRTVMAAAFREGWWTA